MHGDQHVHRHPGRMPGGSGSRTDISGMAGRGCSSHAWMDMDVPVDRLGRLLRLNAGQQGKTFHPVVPAGGIAKQDSKLDSSHPGKGIIPWRYNWMLHSSR